MISDWLAGLLGCTTDMQCEQVASMLHGLLFTVAVLWIAGAIMLLYCYLAQRKSKSKRPIGRND